VTGSLPAGPTSSGRSHTEGGDHYSLTNRATGLVLDGGGNVGSGSLSKQWTYGVGGTHLTFKAS
jgi:alpha-L-fucosidase